VEEARVSHTRWALVVVLVAALTLAAGPSSAAAQEPPPIEVPIFGQFRAVLAQGEGQSVTAADFAAYQASGEPPKSFVNHPGEFVHRANEYHKPGLTRPCYARTAFRG
jgi:hypothetical protein